jgi:hypothetical protein
MSPSSLASPEPSSPPPQPTPNKTIKQPPLTTDSNSGSEVAKDEAAVSSLLLVGDVGSGSVAAKPLKPRGVPPPPPDSLSNHDNNNTITLNSKEKTANDKSGGTGNNVKSNPKPHFISTAADAKELLKKPLTNDKPLEKRSAIKGVDTATTAVTAVKIKKAKTIGIAPPPPPSASVPDVGKSNQSLGETSSNKQRESNRLNTKDDSSFTKSVKITLRDISNAEIELNVGANNGKVITATSSATNEVVSSPPITTAPAVIPTHLLGDVFAAKPASTAVVKSDDNGVDVKHSQGDSELLISSVGIQSGNSNYSAASRWAVFFKKNISFVYSFIASLFTLAYLVSSLFRNV